MDTLTQQHHGVSELQSFAFSPPERINSKHDLFDAAECLSNGRWYEPPISFYGLARSFDCAVHHQSPLYFKRNVICSCFIPTPLLNRQDMAALALDYLVFGNAYLEAERSKTGKLLKLRHLPAKYVRRGDTLDQYWFVPGFKQDYSFAVGSVGHVRNPDIHQEIYGMPEYLAALVSAALNHDATYFRRNYYINGSHAGVIVYLTDPVSDQQGVEDLKRSLTDARGDGAFKNLFVYAAGGKKDGLQILPFSQIAAKDEFLGVKEATRDDMLAAHRVPPQLMGIIPTGAGGMGDPEKAAKIFAINELYPVMEALKGINEWLGEEAVKFAPYALVESAAPQTQPQP
ncbi:MAG: phage portal protein [Aeromonas sp.]